VAPLASRTLAREAVCVCDLEEMLAVKQPTVGYRLKQLLHAGLVEREKRGSFGLLLDRRLRPGTGLRAAGLRRLRLGACWTSS
jgi:DNA-binding transcriptional ArsR family regulator